MMKHKALSALIAVALVGGGITTASAQDGSWYLAPRLGTVFPDSNRGTDDSLYSGIGLGWWVNPNLAVDVEYAINNADFKDGSTDFRRGHQWESVQVNVTGRWFFGDQGSSWRPYVLGGLGFVRHAAYSSYIQEAGWDPAALLGAGIQYNFNQRMALRGEIFGRYDKDNNSLRGQVDNNGIVAGDYNHFVDGIVAVGLTIGFGGSEVAPPPPPPAAPPPPPPPPAAEQPEDVAVVIDLRGVNFKFDRPRSNETDIAPSLQEPTADSIAILDQAVDVLTRNPSVKVELVGNTDSVGSEAYNQGLSERRARIVNDYLTSHGVSASQVVAVRGDGETNPIDTNDTKEGRARNRRTEIVVGAEWQQK